MRGVLALFDQTFIRLFSQICVGLEVLISQEHVFNGWHIDDIFVLRVDLIQTFITQSIDESGYSLGLLVDFGDGIVREEGVGSAGDFELMLDIGVCFVGG